MHLNLYTGSMSIKTTFDYSTRILNGDVVRLSGRFYDWQGTITVRPGEDGDDEPRIAYSSSIGCGKPSKRVETLALAAFAAAQR